MDSYLCCYDLSAPKRLRKVARCCEDYSYHKQLSVFHCRLSATYFVKLRSRLYDIIDLQEDHVLFVPLCGKCIQHMDALGRPTDPPEAKDTVIVR